MRTNKEKYDYYLGKIKQAEAAYIADVFPSGVPPYVYSLGRKRISKEKTCGARINKFYGKSSPSRNDVSTIKSFAKSASFSLSDIYIECESFEQENGRTSHSSWAHNYAKVLSEPHLSFSPWELRKALRENRERYTVKDGQISCDYCGKAVNKSEAVKREIVSIATYGKKGKLGRYCKWQCGAYDQMAHEG